MLDIDARLDAVFQDSDCSGPVPIVAIQAAQKELGLLFPPSYRRFLETYGAALALGCEIEGLPHEATDPDECPQWGQRGANHETISSEFAVSGFDSNLT